MNREVANTHFPLWKVEMRESVYGRDSGMSYSDPENDIRKTAMIVYYSKESVDSDWKEEYSEHMGEFSYGAHQMVITLTRLQELYHSFPDTEKHCMFEHEGRMFKFEYWCDDQKCLCGESIDGDYYDDYNEDWSIKVDMVKSYVFPYEYNELVVMGRNVYLNQKRVGTLKEIAEKCGCEEYQITNMYPDFVRENLGEMFREADSYKTLYCSGGFRR